MRAQVTVDGEAVDVEFDYNIGDPNDGEGESYDVRIVKQNGREIPYVVDRVVDALIDKRRQLIEEARRDGY